MTLHRVCPELAPLEPLRRTFREFVDGADERQIDKLLEEQGVLSLREMMAKVLSVCSVDVLLTHEEWLLYDRLAREER